jgi:monothiol glutaredoxin
MTFRMPPEQARAQIQQLVTANPVVLFMKGNRRAPQCGFSAQVVQILDGIVPEYETVDVLSDPALRDGIKEFSSWPTIPQLYIRGEFVGGCDIVREMHASGELQKKLGVDVAPAAPPRITVTAAAAAEIAKAAADVPGEHLRLEVSPQFENDLYFDTKKDGDAVVEAAGLTLLVDRATATRASGATIDFVTGPKGAGFKIDNPNEPPRVRALSAKDLARMLDASEPVELFDVRPEVERARAKIARARPLDAAGVARLEGLPKDTPVVFHCHHGVRSRAAAQEALRIGLTRVYNLEGGIAAWSADVDPSVPQY